MLNQKIIQLLPKPIPITEQKWPKGTVPLVSICCITYNHEKFIRECLDGFLMQQTTFPVEILIHDDASTDKTSDIIREYESQYPSLIKPIYQDENQYSQGIKPFANYQLPRARGEYIALCEGDDYWTSPLKVQKQVEILESDHNINLCFHKALVVAESEVFKKNKSTVPSVLEKNIYTCAEITKANIIPTCSVLLVRESIVETPEWFYNLPMGDWPRWVMACKEGYAYGINSEMAVYRMHSGSVWSSLSIEKQLMGVYDFYCEIEKNGPKCAQKAAADARRELMLNSFEHYKSTAKLNRITNHIFLGPILKAWKRFINNDIL